MPYGTVKVDQITTSTQTVSVDGLAPKASPALTGTPAAPTAAADTSTTQIATTAFVTGQAASSAPVMNGSAVVGTSVKFARADHVHPSDTAKANLASPALTGVPTAPTAAADTDTTQIATTAYVVGQTYAKIGSPSLTGTPTAPTAASDTNTTQIATTAYVVGQGYAKTSGPTFTASVTLTAQAPVRFADSDGSHWVAFRAPATVASNVTWTLPAADGTANQVIRTDGAGNLSFITLSSGASVGVCIALG